MQIGQTTQTENIYQTQRKIASDTLSEETVASTDQVSISSAGQNAEAKWQDIASKYDVTNISTQERAAMANELKQNDLISSEQQMRLMSPLSMNDDLSTKVDYLSAVQNNKAVADGVPAALKSLNILEHLYQLSGNTNNQDERALNITDAD